MNERNIIPAMILTVILIGLCAGVVGIGLNLWGPNPHQDTAYAAHGNSIIVRPQGDPLWDEHYAKNVNVPNSEAVENEATANKINAQAKQIKTESTMNLIGLYALLGIVAAVVMFAAVAIIAKPKH